MNWVFKYMWFLLCVFCIVTTVKFVDQPAAAWFGICAILSGLCSMLSYGMQANTK